MHEDQHLMLKQWLALRHKRRIYIAGPMRGYDRYNFPAFDAAQAFLEEEGWDVVSPAEIDRVLGLDETQELPDWFTIEGALRRDFSVICTCEAIAFLPNWQPSTGAVSEKAIGEYLGLEFYNIDPEKRLFERWTI